MLRYYRFHADLPHPVPAKPVYVKRTSGGAPGSGWPEHCPPIRTANGFGWDVINPFRMRFLRDKQGNWDIEEQVQVESDIDLGDGVSPHPQINAWFWEKGQQRPHVITDNVYALIRHQVKVSTYLYFETEPGWMLLMKGVPRTSEAAPAYTVIEAVIETDWYPPAHPWHGVLELPRIEVSPVDEVVIEAGEPLFRIVPLQRAEYEATEMSPEDFGEYFEASQEWLKKFGHDLHEGGRDVMITGAYAKQQEKAVFKVVEEGKG